MSEIRDLMKKHQDRETINHGWETQGRKLLDGIPGKDPDGFGGGGRGY